MKMGEICRLDYFLKIFLFPKFILFFLLNLLCVFCIFIFYFFFFIIFVEPEHTLKKYIDLLFRAVLGSQQNWGRNTVNSHMLSTPTPAQPPPLSAFPTKMVHLLQLMSHIGIPVIIQSPQFTLGFVLGFVPFCEFDQWCN